VRFVEICARSGRRATDVDSLEVRSAAVHDCPHAGTTYAANPCGGHFGRRGPPDWKCVRVERDL